MSDRFGSNGIKLRWSMRGRLRASFVMLCRELAYTKEQRDQIIKDMTSSNYDHLIQVFDRNFGDYVDLVTAKNSSAILDK